MEADERTVALEAACREAGPDGPDPGWRARWAAAVAPLSAEEVRTWCRLRWAAADAAPGDAGADPVALAPYWGVAAVAAPGTPAMLAEAALRLHRAGRHRLAGAAVQALADLALGAAAEAPEARGREAIGELGRLRAMVRHRGLARRIGQALAAAGAQRGLDAEGLQDLVVADGGLGADGARTWRAGDHDVYLFLTDDGEVEATIFERGTGRALGAQAQALDPAHFGAFQEARAVQRVLADTLATQKVRLEAALEAQRAWPAAVWHEVFDTHPIMRHLAGRLVWALEGPDGASNTVLPESGLLLSADGSQVGAPAGTTFRLLHPAIAEPAVVRAWQDRLVSRRLVQPFKQIFREVVRPTPAEAASAGHEPSARFEGVAVRLRPLAALLRARGWAGLGGVGPGGYVGRRDLAGHGLAAVLTFRPVGKHRDPQRRQVALGRLGFVEPGEGPVARARAIAQVPAVAYSEAMRDVALAAAAAGAAGAEPGEAADLRVAALAPVAHARADLVRGLLPQMGLAANVEVLEAAARIDCAGQRFRLDLATGEVTVEPSGRRVDLDGLERADLPLYLPHEGADAPTAAVLATLVWLAKFGRACAERER